MYLMKILKFSLLFVFTITLSFCGNDKKSSDGISEENAGLKVVAVDTKKEEKNYPAPALTAKFKNEKIGNAYKHYSKLQNALVNTNAKDAAIYAEGLAVAMKNIGSANVVTQALKKVVVSQDIKIQREQFVIITNEMEKLLENSLDAGMVYKMYCPMAFKNKGAYWLSSDKQVQNPYFGDRMLKCGRVDSAIQ